MAAPDPAQQLSKDSSCTGGGVHTCPSGGPPGSSPTWRGGFFKNLQRLRVLGIMTGAGRELAVAERAQFAAQRRLAERDPKLLPDPQGQILQPPANHAVDRRHRPPLDDVHQGLALAVIQLAGVPRSLAVDQAVRAVGVEPHNPVPKAARLPQLAGRMHEEGFWAQSLSLGEQQRLAIARALLAKPDWLFLGEATAALDEPTEAEGYRTLSERLSDTTLVSIGHRSTLTAFHERRIDMRPGGGGSVQAGGHADLSRGLTDCQAPWRQLELALMGSSNCGSLCKALLSGSTCAGFGVVFAVGAGPLHDGSSR